MFLFKKENPGKTSIIDSQIKKVKRKQKIKFSGENELFSQVSAFQVNNDILPFSLHCKSFVIQTICCSAPSLWKSAFLKA